MIVISDCSCVSNLLAIRHLHLLSALFGIVIIPPEVKTELIAGHGEAIADVLSQQHIEVKEVLNKDYCKLLQSKFIHKGEAEAITIAIELKADLLLIDELEGRKLASRLGIPVTGILGILLSAKNKGLIKQISPLIADLSSNGFRIATALIDMIKKEAGELE